MQDFFLDTLGANLQIHSNTGHVDFWFEPSVEGLDSPDHRTTQYAKPGEDGTVVSSQFYGARLVSLPGYITGSSPAQFEANRRALVSALSVQRDSTGRPRPRRCQFTTLAGLTYFFDAFPSTKPVIRQSAPTSAKFLIQLTVPRGVISSATETTFTATPPSGGGFVLPVVLPIVSSASTGGSVTTTNTGTATSLPVLTLTGPLTNPYFRNATTNQAMQLNYLVAADQTVVIDMYEKTILLNGTSSILSAKTDESNWFGIDPGDNDIRISSGSSSDTGNLTGRYYAAVVGV